MGGGGSKPDPGSQQQLLGQFSGTDPVDVSDPFWARLLDFPVPLTRLPPVEVEATTIFHCEQLGAALEEFLQRLAHAASPLRKSE